MNGLCIRELARITRGDLRLGVMPPLGGDLEPVGRIVIDSRKVEPGDVFWGLVGRYHDGSHFAEEAFLRGASGVVVAGRCVEAWAGKFSLQVEDANWALWQLARAVRRKFSGRVLAITGEGSQAVLRQMLHTLLGSFYSGSTCCIDPQEKTALPFAMLDLCENHDYAVFEMPRCPRGEIQSQSHLCDPQIGVINSLAKSRYTEMSNAKALVSGQRELLSSLSSNGWAILSSDFPGLRNVAKNVKAKTVWTGCGSDADVVAQNVAFQNGELQFSIDGIRIQIPNAGRHDLSSALAAYAVGRAMDLSPREIAVGLSQYPGVPGRYEIQTNKQYTVINDLHDCDFSATTAAIDYLRDYPTEGKRVFVLGDLEDAPVDSQITAKLVGECVVATCGADWLFSCGEQAATMIAAAKAAGMPHSRAIQCETMNEAADRLKRMLGRGDVVLVKGKQKVELQRLVDELVPSRTKRLAA